MINLEAHSILGLCKVAGVSRSGFYSSLQKTLTVCPDEKIVQNLFNKKKGRFGIRRLKMAIGKLNNERDAVAIYLKNLRSVVEAAEESIAE